ncbi:ATPase F0F1 [Alteromonas pelagimontana]|uniref:ATPase F0F1 n=1 Tax=Alteromonas pelagimontana TaxID=1858656 RepID=A0A6M4MFL1_9ALTE|nr:ATP synthase subunit I [Alteromonas pelagimontana]QJR80966.1 ATPase F0F1 [Alteromonas pelagimontana]
MKRDLAANGKRLAKKGTIYQLGIAVLLVLFSSWFISSSIAVSTGIGALISILPNALFAVFAFRYAGASKNELVARSFSQGAKVKLAMTVILFVVAFKGMHADPIAVFLAYAVTTVTYWVALFRRQ